MAILIDGQVGVHAAICECGSEHTRLIMEDDDNCLAQLLDGTDKVIREICFGDMLYGIRGYKCVTCGKEVIEQSWKSVVGAPWCVSLGTTRKDFHGRFRVKPGHRITENGLQLIDVDNVIFYISGPKRLSFN